MPKGKTKIVFSDWTAVMETLIYLRKDLARRIPWPDVCVSMDLLDLLEQQFKTFHEIGYHAGLQEAKAKSPKPTKKPFTVMKKHKRVHTV